MMMMMMMPVFVVMHKLYDHHATLGPSQGPRKAAPGGHAYANLAIYKER